MAIVAVTWPATFMYSVVGPQAGFQPIRLKDFSLVKILINRASNNGNLFIKTRLAVYQHCAYSSQWRLMSKKF